MSSAHTRTVPSELVMYAFGRLKFPIGMVMEDAATHIADEVVPTDIGTLTPSHS